jgi:hypothetical protein
MLLKFHHIHETLGQDKLQVLRDLRNVICEEGDRDHEVHNDYREALAEQIMEIREKMERTHKRVTEISQDLARINDPHLTDLVKQYETAITKGTTTIMEYQKREAQLGRVVEFIDHLAQLEYSRYDFLQAALPDVDFCLLWTPNDPNELLEMLVKYGPIYASGGLTCTVRPNDGGNLHIDRAIAVSEFTAEGRHAVVIAGLSDAETVFYKDPNNTDEIKCVPYQMFMAADDLQFLTIRCKSRTFVRGSDGLEVSCIHCSLNSGPQPALS